MANILSHVQNADVWWTKNEKHTFGRTEIVAWILVLKPTEKTKDTLNSLKLDQVQRPLNTQDRSCWIDIDIS